MAGPFRIEGKSCTIVVGQAQSPLGRVSEYMKVSPGPRTLAAIVIVGIIAVTAAAVAIYKKKTKV